MLRPIPRGGGVTGVCGKSLHTLYPVALKMAPKYTLSHNNFAKINYFKRTLKGIFPHDTLSHKFLINCNTLSHNFYRKRTPYVEGYIPSSQVWEYPRPGPILQTLRNFYKLQAFLPSRSKILQ